MSAEYVSKVNGKPLAAAVAAPSSPLSTAIDAKVSKSGDTMSGRLTLQKTLSQVITGTGTAASSSSGTYYPAKWKYDIGIATPTAGDQMVIKLPVAGHDYGVYISTDNGTTYFPVARHTGASRLTTQYPNGAYVCVVFEAYVSGSSGSGQVNDIFPVAGGTARTSLTTGCWRVVNDYDSGNTICQLRTENGRFYAGSTGCNPYSLVCLDKDGKYSMLISAGSGTGTSKTINTTGKFKLAPVILYYSANNTTAANALVSSTYATFFVHQQIDTRYSHNYTTTFTTNSPLYIECSIDEDGYWSPTTKCITQTLAAGNYYIYLGQTYSTAYQVSLAPEHPVYYYDGTNLVDYTFFSEPMYDAKYARNDTAGDGWVRLAHTSSGPRQNSDVNAIWNVVYANASGGIYSEQLFLDVRYNSSGKGVLAQFKRRYINDKTSSVKFAVKVTGVGGSGNTSVELWAFLHKAWNGLSIKQVAGDTYSLNKRNSTTWYYESYKAVGGTTKPVEDATNNIYVYDPTNEIVPAGSFVPTTRKVNGHALSADVTVTAADVSAVRYDTNAQGLNDTQKSNARTNIGAGTSNLSLGTTSTTAAKGDHTHTVKINGSEKTIAATGGTAVDLGTYLTEHQDISGKADKVSITGATKCKITYNSQGIVTAGADLAASDIPNLSESKITTKYDKVFASQGASVSGRYVHVCTVRQTGDYYGVATLLMSDRFWNYQHDTTDIITVSLADSGGQNTSGNVRVKRVNISRSETSVKYYYVVKHPAARDISVELWKYSNAGSSTGTLSVKLLNISSATNTWGSTVQETEPENAVEVPFGGAIEQAIKDGGGNTISSTYFKSSGNVTLVSGTATKIGTQNGTDVKITLPTIPAAANNGALQLQLNGGTATSKFTANQSGNSTLAFSTGSTAGTFKVDSTEIAIAGFTKVESSSTNGKIKINGTDTTVYTHPTQTAYSAKGSATKVPKITTDSTGHVTSIEEVTISGVAPASHPHGNIQNGGTLQTNDITIASGDKLVVTDSSDSNKVARTSVSFDGSTTTKALTPKGTFEAFAKSSDITMAIQALDVSSVGGDGKYISAISEADGKISATATTMDTAPTASSTKAVTSGGVKTALDGKVNIANTSLEGQTTTLLAQVQAMAVAGTHYARFYTRSDSGSANISDKPVSGNHGFVCEVICKRYNNSSDYRYNLTCWLSSSSPYVATVASGATSITWTQLSETNHTHTTSIAADSSSGTVVTLAHNTQYKLTTGGTSVLFKTPADSNTDTKVTQTKDDSGATAYPLLMAGATDPNGSATTSRYDSNVKLTPSTNTISANISGNAATATSATNDSDGNAINATYLKLSGGTMTGKLTTKADQYTDDGTTGTIDMQNSNIVGLNSIYTKDASGDASEGIHFYRDATHTDTLWMAGGHMYFVPNRALSGTSASTSAANSNKVAILPATLVNGYLLVTDGTDGNVGIVDPGSLSVGYSVSSQNSTKWDGWKIVVGSLGQATDTIYFVTT